MVINTKKAPHMLNLQKEEWLKTFLVKNVIQN